MRHIAILALVLVAAATANAAALNCTKLAAPAHNFYAPTGSCADDAAIKACVTAYTTCTSAASTCSASLSCVSSKLRCFESATTGANCTSWAAMFSNEKLYLAAGGDYNGSTLELSCQNAICGLFSAKPTLTCVEADYKGVCFDAITGSPTPAPAPPSTIPPAGAVVVSFKINGNKTAFDALLATVEGRAKAKGIVLKILVKILNVAEGKIVIISIKTGSLIIDFYTTDSSLNVTTVAAKMEAAKTSNQADLFGELATAAGIPLTELGVGEVTVGVATPAPTPAPGTPGTPSPGLTDSASLVATTIAVLVAAVALLL